MKLVTFESGGQRRLGAVIDGDRSLLDLAGACTRRHRRVEPALADMLALIDAGPAGQAMCDALVADPPEEDIAPLGQVRLLAPLPQPRQIRDFLLIRSIVDQPDRL